MNNIVAWHNNWNGEHFNASGSFQIKNGKLESGSGVHPIPGRVFEGACVRLMDHYRILYHLADRMYVCTAVLTRADGTAYAIRLDGWPKLVPVDAIYKVI